MAAVQMLTGPTPMLTNWITHRPVVETGMVTLKLSQPGLFGPLQREDPAAGGIGIWPAQVTVGLL